MVGERHPLPIRRNFRVADPVDTVEQNLPNGILQTPVAVFRNVSHHGHVYAVCGPVCVLHILQHFSWSSPAQRNPRQRPGPRIAAVTHRVEPDRQFSALGDRKQFRILQSEFARARIIRARQVQLVIPALPRCAVNHAAIGRKPRIPHRPRTKRNLLIFSQRRRSAASPQPPAHTKHHQRQCQTTSHRGHTACPAAAHLPPALPVS